VQAAGLLASRRGTQVSRPEWLTLNLRNPRERLSPTTSDPRTRSVRCWAEREGRVRRERHRGLSLPRWKDWSGLVLRRWLRPGRFLGCLLNAVRRALGGRLPDGPSPAVEVVDQLVLLGLRSSASRTATRERAPQHDRFGSRKHEVDLLRLDANEAVAAPNREPLRSVVALVEYDVLDEAFIAERRPNPVALAVAKPIARSECRWALRSAQSILYVSKRRRNSWAERRWRRCAPA
jgi:hypothetical protein